MGLTVEFVKFSDPDRALLRIYGFPAVGPGGDREIVLAAEEILDCHQCPLGDNQPNLWVGYRGPKSDSGQVRAIRPGQPQCVEITCRHLAGLTFETTFELPCKRPKAPSHL